MRISNILNGLLLVSGSYAWKWASKGKASVTRYGSMGILSCNCKISAMEVGPACAINENAYGGYDSLGSGPACGMCYKLTPYGSTETDKWPATPDDLPGPMVFKVTDICPHNANPAWCPSPDSEPVNSRGFEYHFDINVDSWQPEKIIEWFGKGQLGTMMADFELVSCEEWIGWDQTGKYEGVGDNPWWGCCPANPGVLSQKDSVCGSPATNSAPAPQESDRIKPADFPFIDDIGGGNTKTTVSTSTTTSSSTQPTSSTCWSTPDYPCCKTCDIAYTDDHQWGFENGEWCGIDSSKCSSSTVTCSVQSQGYPCCSTCEVAFVDEHKWGVENGEWCGISEELCGGSEASSCPAAAMNYPCCENTCEEVYKDEFRWGVENGEWCGLKDSC